MSKKPQMPSLILAVVTALAFFSLGVANGMENSVSKMRIGQHTYSIPERHLIDKESPFWLRIFSRRDAAPTEVNVVFSTNELAAAISGLQMNVDLIGTLKPLVNESGRRSAEQSLAQAIWSGKGRFSQQTTEPIDEASGLFRVRWGGNMVFWEIVRKPPDSAYPMPADFWVASCTIAGNRPVREGRCEAAVIVDDLLLQFSIQEQDISRLERVRHFLSTQIRAWRIP